MSRDRFSSEAWWQDIEYGSYAADLPLWAELSDAIGKHEMVLDLGCGTGRVTMHLVYRRDQVVVGVDRDMEMILALMERSGKRRVYGECQDVRDFTIADSRFGLVLAPMQLIQLLADREERISCLTRVRESMLPGARAAFAIAEDPLAGPIEDVLPPLPDTLELGHMVFSSLPLPIEIDAERIVLRRLRQTVDPQGELSEETSEAVLRRLLPGTLEEEGREAGLIPVGRREVPATDAYVGSTVVLLEKES